MQSQNFIPRMLWASILASQFVVYSLATKNGTSDAQQPFPQIFFINATVCAGIAIWIRVMLLNSDSFLKKVQSRSKDLRAAIFPMMVLTFALPEAVTLLGFISARGHIDIAKNLMVSGILLTVMMFPHYKKVEALARESNKKTGPV